MCPIFIWGHKPSCLCSCCIPKYFSLILPRYEIIIQKGSKLIPRFYTQKSQLKIFIVVVSNSEAVLFLPFQLSEFPPDSQADGRTACPTITNDPGCQSLCFEVNPETARHETGDRLREQTQNSSMKEVSLKLVLGFYLHAYLPLLKPYSELPALVELYG